MFGGIQKNILIFQYQLKKQTTKMDKDGNNKIVNISYKIKFIDSFDLCQFIIKSCR